MNSKGIFHSIGIQLRFKLFMGFILFERFKTFPFLNGKTFMLYWSFCGTFILPLLRNWNSPQFLHRGKSENGANIPQTVQSGKEIHLKTFLDCHNHQGCGERKISTHSKIPVVALYRYQQCISTAVSAISQAP